jgi:hypothetical protein
MVAWALPPTAVTLVGGPGTVGADGVTALDAVDGDEFPIALVATTENV